MKKNFTFLAFLIFSCQGLVAQTCSGGGTLSTATLTLTGQQSMGEGGDAANATGTLAVTAGDVVGIRVTGVNLTTVGPSYCSEAGIEFRSPTNPAVNSVFLTFSGVEDPSPCTDLPLSGLLNLATIPTGSLVFPTTGPLTWELLETFDDNPGTADANYTAGTVTMYVCPTGQNLPVILKSFFVKPLETTNRVVWETTVELNNAFHIVERSSNGTVWEELGRKKGQLESNELIKYEFLDEKPLPTAYYRLRSQDIDGKETYSAIVNVARSSYRWAIQQVFPSPARDFTTVKFNSDKTETVGVQITDIYGRVVIEKNIEAFLGENLAYFQIQDLPAGAYFATLKTAQEVSQPMRFIKY
jgi:hypothetical protein